ncbi:MAG: hypothetical protein MI784_16830 [Cytophagales bacterium]|nr:hypothetical protein [Cytophagales bacterium]
MITISAIAEKIISESQYYQEGLAEGLINISALARKIKPTIERELRKEVQEGAVVMAIKRMVPSLQKQFDEEKLFDYFQKTGEIIIRSELVDFAYKNSETLIKRQMSLLQQIQQKQDVFFASSKGIYESNIVISASCQGLVDKLFREETLLTSIKDLASVTLRSPESADDIPGVFFYITKMFQWRGVNIVEIISTKHEMTFIVHKKDINVSFYLLQTLKDKG